MSLKPSCRTVHPSPDKQGPSLWGVTGIVICISADMGHFLSPAMTVGTAGLVSSILLFIYFGGPATLPHISTELCSVIFQFYF
ncbi:hypothetical protein COCOBI_16-1630 [Coccomyxa sp. Obi]|nr:hypothetical protein COCOBI_16-1630 [Coccomyxa sp. Obi]